MCLNNDAHRRTLLVICKKIDDASSRYRIAQFTDLLAKAGWRLEFLEDRGRFRQRLAILRQARRADAVLVLRRTYSLIFLRLLRWAASYLLYDFDDAVFCKSDGAFSRRRQAGFTGIVSLADQVWAGNDYLAAAATKSNHRVTVLPTAVKPEAYWPVETKALSKPVLVWIGSHSTRKHLETIMPLLKELAREKIDFVLRVIADFSCQTGAFEVDNISWSEEVEAQALATATIGLAPLPDNAYTRGKCALKVLQYMAAGLPVAASAVGVNRQLIEQGRGGLSAGNHEQWKNNLKRLLQDEGLCIELGAAGRRYFLENYSTPVIGCRLLASLQRGFDEA